MSRIGRDAFSVSSLIVLAIVLIAARLRCYHEPLEWDTGTYAAIAREMLAGERLYADAWDIKPPGVFATYAAALWAAGRASGNYDPLPNEGRSHFPLFFHVRRGGALQQRLQAPLQ